LINLFDLIDGECSSIWAVNLEVILPLEFKASLAI